ncbi:protein of unknown function [Candidatus Filomicrobium marinum]|uniref:Uncharacterized protein n=1 Tax=Candidatus Filomicrobium marinum TaxID=1608628 RepID=A0A0D6JC02_9HYPH|nr:protein of unknown function [Candidatus Filomicrobium marinum]CPR16496.1 protein of unknown function [Candidatus Filomicrobium marinum]
MVQAATVLDGAVFERALHEVVVINDDYLIFKRGVYDHL